MPGVGQFGTAAAPIPSRGLWEAGFDANVIQTPFEQYGRSVENGSIANQSLRFTNQAGFPSIISYETTFGWSMAILWHPQTVQSADQVIVNRRVSPFGAANGGWSLHCQAGNTYQVRISDGVSQASATSITTQNTQRPDLIIATYDQANLRIFVNGSLEATTAATLVISNVNRSIRVWGTGGADGTCGMVAMWTRALARSEVSALYADPFLVWRDDYVNEPDVDISPVWNTFFASF